MFSVHSNIWCFALLWSGLCTEETRRLKNTSEIKPFLDNQDDNLIKNNVIAMIQSRMNKDDVKKSLDDFTMVRRKTHFSIPGIIENGNDVNVETGKKNIYPKYRSNTTNSIYSNHEATPTYYENNNNLNEINNYAKEVNSKENGIEYEDLIDVKAKNDMDFLFNKYKENNFENVLTYDQETELLKVLRKQKELLRNIKETEKKNTKKAIVKNDKAVKNKGGKDPKGDMNKTTKKDKTVEKKDIKNNKTVTKKGSKYNKTVTKKGSKDNKTVTKKGSKNDKTTKKKNSKSDKTDKKKNNKNVKADKNKDGKKGNTEKVKKTPVTKKGTSKVTKKDTKTTKKQETKTKKKLTKKTTKKSTKTPVKKEKPTTKGRPEVIDFYDIVAEVEKKKEYAKQLPNYTPFTFETTTTLQTTQPTTTTTVTTTRHSTVLTILNEIDVRSALRNDPYVKRILKMANRKRQRYFKKALINIVN